MQRHFSEAPIPSAPRDGPPSRRQILSGFAAAVLPRDSLDFGRLIPSRIDRNAAYRQPGWHLWDPAMVRTRDGVYHLLFSRWPESLGFDAWATHAEIAWATADRPQGPFRFHGSVLGRRGGGFWDGHSVYNTCLLAHESTFYLYYTGSHGTDSWREDRAPTTRDEDWWTQRDSQRIGVAVASHPGGPWKRFERPLIDTGPGWGQGIVATPNVTPMPGGGFLLAYKTLAPGPGRFGGGVFHYLATSESPLGPFLRHPAPMVDKGKVFRRHFDFHIDDHFEWFQCDRYYAIVKDHDAPYLTPFGRCLYLLESPDGLTWRTAAHPLVKDFRVEWTDGREQGFERLEMPKLLMEKGRPRVLLLAAHAGGPQASFLLLIRLREGKAALC